MVSSPIWRPLDPNLKVAENEKLTPPKLPRIFGPLDPNLKVAENEKLTPTPKLPRIFGGRSTPT